MLNTSSLTLKPQIERYLYKWVISISEPLCIKLKNGYWYKGAYRYTYGGYL